MLEHSSQQQREIGDAPRNGVSIGHPVPMLRDANEQRGGSIESGD